MQISPQINQNSAARSEDHKPIAWKLGLAGCTVTFVAVMVVPLVVPSTRTLSPVVMALAEAGLVPFW
jgi:hypothetical protein